MSPRTIVLAGLAGAAALLVTGCGEKSSAATRDDRPAVAIAVATAGPPEPRAVFRGPGSVTPDHTYRVAFEIPGRVVGVNVDVGDRVAAGEVLASIDAATYREQSQAADAQLASAESQAAKAHAGARPAERAESDDAVAAARAALARAAAAADLARSNDRRYQALLAGGDVAAQQAEMTRTALLDAEQQVAAARAQLASAVQAASLVAQGPRAEDRAAADAGAAEARANAALARTTLAKATIVAPADAYVEQRAVEPGSSAEPGVTAFVLTDAATPQARVAVPEALADRVVVGQHAEVFFEGHRLAGRVTRIEPAADPASRTFEVRVRAQGLAARAGGVVDVALGEQRLGSASIDVAALLSNDGRTFVETYDRAAQTVRTQPVRVVDATGDRALVWGLDPGTTIVVAGQHEARPGDRVRLVNER